MSRRSKMRDALNQQQVEARERLVEQNHLPRGDVHRVRAELVLSVRPAPGRGRAATPRRARRPSVDVPKGCSLRGQRRPVAINRNSHELAPAVQICPKQSLNTRSSAGRAERLVTLSTACRRRPPATLKSWICIRRKEATSDSHVRAAGRCAALRHYRRHLRRQRQACREERRGIRCQGCRRCLTAAADGNIPDPVPRTPQGWTEHVNFEMEVLGGDKGAGPVARCRIPGGIAQTLSTDAFASTMPQPQSVQRAIAKSVVGNLEPGAAVWRGKHTVLARIVVRPQDVHAL